MSPLPGTGGLEYIGNSTEPYPKLETGIMHFAMQANHESALWCLAHYPGTELIFPVPLSKKHRDLSSLLQARRIAAIQRQGWLLLAWLALLMIERAMDGRALGMYSVTTFRRRDQRGVYTMILRKATLTTLQNTFTAIDNTFNPSYHNAVL